MKCYDFELNISTYIAGELKQSLHSSFKEHRDNCSNCNEKFTDISYLLKNMSNINPVITSDNFIDNLSKKIQSVDNQGPSIWEWLINLRPFGFQPAPALGFLLGFIMITTASYLLFNIDKIPNIDINKLSKNSQEKIPSQFKPSLVIPPQNETSIAESDSSIKPDVSKRYNDKIKLTGGK